MLALFGSEEKSNVLIWSLRLWRQSPGAREIAANPPSCSSRTSRVVDFSQPGRYHGPPTSKNEVS